MNDVLKINFGDSIKEFQTLVEASSEVSQNLRNAGTALSGILPDINQYLQFAEETTNASFKKIKKLDKQIASGKFESDYERTNAINERAFHVNSISSIMQDIDQVKSLGTVLSGISNSKELLDTVSTIIPQLYSFAQDATKIFRGTNQATDRQLVQQIKINKKFQDMVASNSVLQSAGLNLDRILEYAIIKAVPQISRGTFIGRMSTNSGAKHIYDSFKSMLPSAFNQLEYNKPANQRTYASFGQGDSILLTPGERGMLSKLIKRNVYAAEAAEMAGIARRENGNMLLADRISRGSVKAMGGNMMPGLIGAAKGMGMYGIEDVDDPDSWTRVARKGNKRFLGNLAAMRNMSDHFAWMQAGYYDEAMQRAHAKAISTNMKSVGQIKFSPKTDQYEVALYTLDDIENKRNWNDGAKYKDYKDYHHFAMDSSLHLRNIMQHSGKGIRAHNSYLDDVIYLDIDQSLRDPNSDSAIREAVLEKYKKVFAEGIRPGGQGEKYVFSRINPKTGIEFVRESIYNAIKQDDEKYFSAGLAQEEFKTWEEFASAMEYRNKNATPGQSITSLFGSRPIKKIRVVDLKDTSKIDPVTKKAIGPGLDGASIISNSLVPVGFQGRAHGIKTALSSMNIEELTKAYGGQLRLTAYTNDPNEKGKTILIDPDTDAIINAADVKNAKLRFPGMSNAQIEQEVLKEIQRYNIYAARTYDDARGKTQWMSGQMAQLLRMDPTVNMMFAKEWMKQYQRVGTAEGAAEILFGKDDERHALLMKDPSYINDPAVQSQIREYRQSLLSRMSRGDLYLGDRVSAYRAMVAPWIVDAFNADMKQSGMWNNVPIADRQKMESLTMGQDAALFTKTLATKFGIGRYPATTRSLQTISNLSRNQNFKEFAKRIGLDENAIYLSPQAQILEFLQDADFDGDVVELIELAGGKNTTVQQIMDKVFDTSLKYQEELVKRGKITQEQLNARKAVISKMRYEDKDRNINDAEAQVEYLKAMADAGFLMGAPNGVIRNAYQLKMNDEAIQAIVDAEIQYSTNSAMKHGRYTETTASERGLLGKYKPFSEFYHMIDKARDENGHIDFDKIADKSLYAINLPSANMSSSMRSAMLTRFMAKQMGIDINSDYNWEDIFERMEGPIDTTTAFGRMKAALRKVDIGMLNADYVMPSDRMVAELQALRAAAIEEEALNVSDERKKGLLTPEEFRKKDRSVATERVNRGGGNVIANLIDYALTQESSSSPENVELMLQLARIGGSSMHFFGEESLGEFMTASDRTQLRRNRDARSLMARANTYKRINDLDVYDRTQFDQKIDAMRWSPSMLFELLNDDIKWADKRINKNYVYDDSNIYSILGNAAHASIQMFMDRRKNATGGKLSDTDLLQASKDALEFYNKYLDNALEPDQKGSDRPPRNFTNAELKQIQTAGTTPHRVAESMRQFLGHNILGIFPEDEWEVVGTEVELGDYVNMGKQRTKDENVRVSANTDAMFRNRQTGEVVGVDWKSYADDLTPEELRKSQIQNMIYASAIAPYLKDLGITGNLSTFHTINPVTGTTTVFGAGDSDIKEVMDSVQSIITYAHEILPNDTAGDVVTRLHMLRNYAKDKLGFTPELLRQAENDVERNKQVNSAAAQVAGATGTAFGGAMMLHDEYTQALKAAQGVKSFAFKHTPKGNAKFIGNDWENQYNTLAQQDRLVESLRIEGMEAQANMLEGTVNAARANLDFALPQAAISDAHDMAVKLDDMINDRHTSKQATGLVEYFENVTSSISHAQDAYNTLINKINANNIEIAGLDAAIDAEQDPVKKAGLKAKRDDLKMQTQRLEQAEQDAAPEVDALNKKGEELKSKIIGDAMNNLEEDLAHLTATRDGKGITQKSKLDENVDAFKSSVSSRIADLNLYAEKFGIDKSSERFKKLYDGLFELLSDESIKQVRDTFEQQLNKDETSKLTIADYKNKAKANKIDQQLMQDYRNYNMARTQYGPTIIGRSWQQNDQAYTQWAGRYASYQQQILDERATIAGLKQRRDDAQLKGDTGTVTALDADITAATNRLSQYEDGLDHARDAMKEFSSFGGLMRTSIINASNALENMILQLGKSVLQKAFKEASSFIKQFDADMTTIQEITGKTDDQMTEVRSSAIEQAKSLKTSVSNVTATRASLYRQGLSDAEVNERTDAIIKFSTVTGAKVTDATKNLTAAIQTGLVGSVEEAMDVLAALGDSAATTAEEIAKGMQKAAASAKVAGVSYEELTAMLTITTSKTQLSGTQSGTFFQTLFSRMNRVTKEGYVTDESGETTNINDVEAALKTAGITLREGKNTFRNSFDVLRDIASVWEGLNDLQKNNITYAMASSRQSNMFNTLMSGMGEDGGKLLDEYLGLAENSEGAVQTKYEVALQSIQAALDNLKSTFDGLIETIGTDNIFTNLVNSVSSAVQGLTEFNNAGEGAITVIGILGTAIAALIAKMVLFSALKNSMFSVSAGLISTIVALGAGAVAFGAIGGSNKKTVDFDKATQASYDEQTAGLQKIFNTRNSNARSAIEDISDITTAYKDLTELSAGDSLKLNSAVSSLIDIFPDLASSINMANAELSDYVNFVNQAKNKTDEMTSEDALMLYERKRNQLKIRMDKANEEFNKNIETIQVNSETWNDGHVQIDSGMYTGQNGSTSLATLFTNPVGWAQAILYDDPTFKYMNRLHETYDPNDLAKLVSEGLITQNVLNQYAQSGQSGGILKFLESHIFNSLQTPEGIMHALELDAAGIETNPQLVRALDSYLKDTSVIDKGAFTGISSYEELLATNMWSKSPSDNGISNSALMLQALSMFMQTMLDKESHTNKLIAQGNEEAIAQRRSEIQTILTEEIGDILTFVGEGDTALSEGLIDNYFEQYQDSWSDFESVDEYIYSILKNNNNLKRRFFKPDSKLFKYSLRDANGNAYFGFDEMTEKAVEDAYKYFISSGGEERFTFLNDYMNKENGSIDLEKIMNMAYNNSTNLPAKLSINEIAASVGVTSKSKNYVDEYRQLWSMLVGSGGNIDDFVEKTRGVENLQPLMENDMELVQAINDIRTNGGIYTRQYLQDYLMSKALEGQSAQEFVSSIFSSALEISEQQRIAKTDINKLTPEMIKTIADTFSVDSQTVRDNMSVFQQAYINYYATNLDAFMANARESIDGLVQTYMDTNNLANVNPADIPGLSNIIAMFKDAGLNISVDSTGNVTVTQGKLPSKSKNPLKAEESIFTKNKLAGVAGQLLIAQDWETAATLYSEPLLEQIKSAYPELYRYLNLEDKTTAEAQALKQQILIDIKITGYDDLVKVSEITQSIANNAETLSSTYNNKETANAYSAGTSELMNDMQVYYAMTRMQSNGAFDSDYALIADAFGLKESDVRAWNALDISSYMSNATGIKDMAINGANLLRKTIHSDKVDSFDATMSESGLVWDNDKKSYVLSQDSRISNAFADAQTAASTIYDPSKDYAEAYLKLMTDYYNSNTNQYDLDKFNEYITNNASDNFKNLLIGTDYFNLLNQGYGQGIAALFTQGAWGIDAFNPMSTNYNNGLIQKYFNALIGGDLSTLSGIADNLDINNAMSSWVNNWNELLSQVLSNTPLTTTQKKQARSDYTSRMLDLLYNVSPDIYNADIISGASALYGTDKERRNYFGELSTAVFNANTQKSMLQLMMGENGIINLEELKSIASDIGWDQSRIEKMTGTSDEVNRVFADVSTQSEQLENSLSLLAAACYDYAAAIQGISIGLGSNEAWTIDNLAAWAGGTGNLSSNAIRRQRINDIYSMAANATDASEFMDDLQTSTIPWTQNNEAVKSIFTDETLAPIFYNMFQHNADGSIKRDSSDQLMLTEGADWSVIQSQLRAASAYAGLGYDGMYSARMSQLDQFTGNGAGGFIGDLLSGNVSREDLTEYLSSDNSIGLQEWIEGLDGGKQALEDFTSGNKNAEKAAQQLANVLQNAGIKSMAEYGDYTDDVASNLEGLRKNSQSSLSTIGNMIKSMDTYYDMSRAASKMKGKDGKGVAGKSLGKDDLAIISSATHLDAAELQNMGADTIKALADGMQSAADEGYINNIGQTIREQLVTDLQSALGSDPLMLDQFIQLGMFADGQLDMSEVAAIAQQLQDEGLAQLANYAGLIGSLVLDIQKSGKEVTVSAILNALGNKANVKGNVKGGGGGGGYRTQDKGGGGGGGGKSDAEKLMQNLKNRITLRDHRIKMTQLQETKYNQIGELANENNMIEYENELQQELTETIADSIVKLREQLAVTEKGTDDWQNLYDAVLEYEEKLDETNNTIVANTIKMKENEQAIRQARLDLEDLVVQEIEARIQKERDMLAASVNMQDMILDAIKQRYQDEWDIVKKDLEKKREALEEEKSLIDKKLQARKDAEDEAKKYEELAEYRKQLALISMDSTRTKDAVELRKKISDIESELAWDIASDEAEVQKESIDDQINALDKYESYGDEDLDALLTDANNFSSEVAEVMQMNQSDMFDWMKANIKDYTYSLEDAQKQMVQSWEDTYKQMLGITDTYWDDVNEILSTRANFAAYMMDSDTYKNASETEKASLLYQWLEQLSSGSYDYYLATLQDGATYFHSDEEYADYTGGSGSGGGGSSGGGGASNPTTDTKKHTITQAEKNRAQNAIGVLDIGDASDSALEWIANVSGTEITDSIPTVLMLGSSTTGTQKFTDSVSDIIAKQKAANIIANANKATISYTKNKKGGLVDYTGFTWVDGTALQPEAFLNSEDRASIRSLLDSGVMNDMRKMVSSFQKISTNKYIQHIFDDSGMTSSSNANVTVGDINISTEHINDELDFSELAERIGQQFVRDLSMQGLSTNKFSF